MVDKHNPYIAGAPVVEQRMFFGRERVFEWIENSLSGKYVDHILVLHGQRRVGKTSVLKHIPNRLPDKYIPVFIDLQGRVSTTLGRFLGWLAREIVRALAAQGLELPRPDRKAFEEDPEYFENVFLPSIRNQMGERCLLLTFDEFDTFESTDAQEGLALPFMAILKRLMDHDYLNFVFSIGSSGRKLENMQAAYTSFFKQALYRKISFLEGEDARDLVIKPVEGVVRYEPEAVDRILQVTSRHPYFVQLVCHELFSECQKNQRWEVTGEDVENILEPVVERGTVNLKFVWDEATALEKWIMAVLATVEEGLSQTEIEAKLKAEQVRHTHQELERAMLRLKDKDVITDDHHFVIHLFRMWLVRNRPLEQVREELEEINPIVNRLLEIGQEYHSKGEYEDAVRNFEEALKVEETNLDARQWLGSSQLERGDYGKAIAEFETVLEVKVDDVVAQKGFCEAYLAMGDESKSEGKLEEAEFAYQQVLGINPEHQAAHQRMAELHHKRAVGAIVGGPEAALEELEKALEYAEEGTFRQTRDELAAFISGDRKLAEVLFAWGQAAREKELWEDAQELLTAYRKESGDGQSVQEAIEEIRGHVSTQRKEEIRHRAGRLERLGRYAEAAEAWGSYLKAAPEEGEKVRAKIAELQAAVKAGGDQKGGMSPIMRGVVVGTAVIVIGAIIALFALPNSPLRAAFAEPTNTAAFRATATQMPTATQVVQHDSDIQTVLDFIQTTEPDQDLFTDQLIFSETIQLEDEKLTISALDGGLNAFEASQLISTGFVIQVDVRIQPQDAQGTCLTSTYVDDQGLGIDYLSDGWGMLGYATPERWDNILRFENPFDPMEFNTVTFIILSEKVSLYINENHIFTTENVNGSVVYNGQGLAAEGAQITCEFQNYKIWDLTGLELADGPAPTPQPTAIPLSWTRLNSGNFLDRDTVTKIVFDPNDPDVMYAGTEHSGIYKTINGGISWYPSSTGLKGSRIDSLVIHPEDSNILYTGVVEDGAYKTEDGGISWKKLVTNHPEDYDWYETSLITLDPNEPNILYFCPGEDIYQSLDAGVTWEFVTSITEQGPQKIAELTVGPEGALYYTDTWFEHSVYRLNPDTQVAEPVKLRNDANWFSNSDNFVSFNIESGTIFAGEFPDLYASDDKGETWYRLVESCIGAAFDKDGNALCLGRDNQIAYSTNGGSTWQYLGDVPNILQIKTGAISPHDSDVFIVGGRFGLYKSTDRGQSWEEISGGLGNTQTNLLLDPVRDMVYIEEQELLTVRDLYAAEVGEWEFTLADEHDPGTDTHTDVGQEGNVYRFYSKWDDADPPAQNSLYLLKDIGLEYQKLDIPLAQWHAKGSFVRNGQEVLYASALFPYQFYVSYDYGTTWELLPSERDPNDTPPGNIMSDPTNSTRLYSTYAGISFSEDGGEHWQYCGPVNPGTYEKNANILSLHPEKTGHFVLATKNQGLVMSQSESCDDLQQISPQSGLDNPNTLSVARHPENPDTIYVGTANGFFISYNGGQSWGPVNDGLLGALTIYSLVVDPNDPGVVYAATPYGIFKLEDK